jgi:hypothetical protein
LACQTTITGDVILRRLVLDDEDVAVTSQLHPAVGADPCQAELACSPGWQERTVYALRSHRRARPK